MNSTSDLLPAVPVPPPKKSIKLACVQGGRESHPERNLCQAAVIYICTVLLDEDGPALNVLGFLCALRRKVVSFLPWRSMLISSPVSSAGTVSAPPKSDRSCSRTLGDCQCVIASSSFCVNMLLEGVVGLEESAPSRVLCRTQKHVSAGCHQHFCEEERSSGCPSPGGHG